MRGNAMKAGTMAGVGFVPGLLVGGATSALLGPIAGAAAGVLVANRVARGLAALKLIKRQMPRQWPMLSMCVSTMSRWNY